MPPIIAASRVSPLSPTLTDSHPTPVVAAGTATAAGIKQAWAEKIDANRGLYGALLQGLLAVVLFSLTAPVTKIALAQLTPELITASRAFFAGLAALLVVLANGWSLPKGRDIAWLLLGGLGVVVGFPYLLALSLGSVSAGSMGIVLAGLPLATCSMAVLLLGERYRWGFWLFALAGAGVLVLYFQRGLSLEEGVGITDASFVSLALLTLLAGGLGYAGGAKASQSLGGWPTICWMLVLALPLSTVAFGYYVGMLELEQGLGLRDLTGSSWLSLGYLALISQWLGFRYWYGAMNRAGVGTISQLQLLQPFFTLAFAVLLLGEVFDWSQWGYLLVIGLAVTGAVKNK